MGFIFKEKDNQPVDPKTARHRAVLLSLPFAIVAILALVFLSHDELVSGFRMPRRMATGLLSVIVVCGGLIVLIFGINAKKQALQISAAKDDDENPWLKRKDWAEGRIASSVRKSILLLWIFVAFWCAASAVISLGVLPQQLRQGNHAALIVLVLPIISLVIVVFALDTTRRWRKFNRSLLVMSSVPASLGGVLAGEIQISTRLQPCNGFHLKLSCVRRKTTGASNNLKTGEKILWEDEIWLRANLPQADPNATVLPVFFRLPAGLLESEALPGDGVHWKLEASAELRGPNFHAAFDVPVFQTAGTPASPDNPAAQYQLSLEEICRQIHSPVQVADLAGGGREFVFPAARNPGFASGATVIWAIWTAIILLLIWERALPPMILVFGAIDLLMAVFVADLWFRRSHVAVNSKCLTVQRSWLAFKKERRFSADEIGNITADVGAMVGHAHYHDLNVRLHDGKEFTLAKHLRSKPEADWLVRQMMAARKEPS
ncbi:MAG TPA: hypothetical protein VMB22_07940 [Verrucomicrobiae bacterium]|nr:hypothetical protein [Verrucomicrobiae bacterium]